MFTASWKKLFKKSGRAFYSSKMSQIGSKQTKKSRSYRFALYSTLGSAAMISYRSLEDGEIELIYNPTQLNEQVVNTIEDIKNGTYNSTPYLYSNFIEIVYGNKIDKREQVKYVEEVIETPDGENLMLGKLIRLV